MSWTTTIELTDYEKAQTRRLICIAVYTLARRMVVPVLLVGALLLATGFFAGRYSVLSTLDIIN